MINRKDFEREAPAIAHAKLDRLWLIREEDGQVELTTTVKDPDNPSNVFALSMTLTRLL